MIATAVTSLWAQTSVEVSLPRNPEVGNRFSLTVTVNNPDGTIGAIKPPTLNGCTYVGGPGVSTSSYTSIINGRMQSSKSTSYTYTYVADSEGTVKVAAIDVTVNGKSYSTNAGQFTVLPASQRSNRGNSGNSGYDPFMGGARSAAQAAQAAAQQQGGGASSSDFKVGANDLFMRVELSQSSVYEQQAVECVIKLYSINGQVTSLAAATIPAFDGCLIENIGAPKNIDWSREHINGENYYTAVVYRALLYPQRAGDITLSGGEYSVGVYRQVLVQDFFSARPVMQEKEVKLKPRATTLHVNALPQPKPADFSGAVGHFTASARLVGNNFKTNEASTLIYTVDGTGNIKFLTEPQLDFPAEFEVYDPHVENNAHISGKNMTGTQTVEFTFVPQSVGKFHIGSHNFVYFDPSKREYVTVPVEGFDIDVAKGADVSSSASSNSKQDIESKNTDIHHIKPGADAAAETPNFITNKAWYWLLYPLLILALVVALIAYSRSATARADKDGQRLNKANKVARKRLSVASKALKSKQYDRFYESLLQALQGYLSDKLTLGASQLSRETISARLQERGAADELIDELTGILDECEMARYTPQSSPEQADQTYSRAAAVINQIENLKRK
jgi:hypothetical protein